MINNNLEDCRKDLGMTQTELGYVFGVKKCTISNWESGNDIIPLNKLIRFCNIYEYSMDYVCGLARSKFKKIKNYKINKDKLGKNLKKLRTKLNLTQQDVADKCSISRATYCHYEIGMNLASTLTLYTICKTYNISMDYLCDRTI